MGAFAREELDKVDAEFFRALVQEGERKILPPRLAGQIFFFADVERVGHFRRGKAEDVAQNPDPVCDLVDFRFHERQSFPLSKQRILTVYVFYSIIS
jgi:hypothetical protein